MTSVLAKQEKVTAGRQESEEKDTVATDAPNKNMCRTTEQRSGVEVEPLTRAADAEPLIHVRKRGRWSVTVSEEELTGVCTSLDDGSGPRSPGVVGFSSGGASLAQLSYETQMFTG